MQVTLEMDEAILEVIDKLLNRKEQEDRIPPTIDPAFLSARGKKALIEQQATKIHFSSRSRIAAKFIEDYYRPAAPPETNILPESRGDESLIETKSEESVTQ